MIILFIVLAILVVLTLVLAFNTMKSIKNARKLTEFKPFYNDDEIMNYALRHQKMIKCKTISVENSYDDT